MYWRRPSTIGSATCTSTGTGYAGSSGALAVNGSNAATAQAGWVGYPSTCTWTATGAGGTKTYTETMTTQAGTPVGGVIYFHNDVSGSPLAATDASGNVLWKENYRPCGERVTNSLSANANNKLWFTGKPQDPQTGLSYVGARYYDPALGRFMGVDPVGYQQGNIHSSNRYAYANNNPYKFVDRDGRYAELAVEVISLSVGYMSLRENMRAGNTMAAITDGVGMLVDIAGAALPGVPGVAGLGIKASREATELGAKGAGDFDAARRTAFEKAGMTDASKVEFSKMDPKTGTVVEFKGQGGAKVGYDGPHASPGPHHDKQHISWQSSGKRDSGGTKRGNEPYSGPQHPSRSDRKEP